MLRKVLEHAQLKVSEAEGTGQLAGYASTWANWDRVQERPVRGAFAASLPTFLKDGFIAYSHDWGTPPIATVTEAYEDEHGLFFRAEFHSTAFAQDVRTVVRERIDRGKSVLTSIGYGAPVTEQVEAPELPGGYGTLLKEIPLLEISVVPVPANPAALLTAAKDAGPLTGLTFDDHSDWALTTLQSYMQRAQAIHAMRAKVKSAAAAGGEKKAADKKAAAAAKTAKK